MTRKKTILIIVGLVALTTCWFVVRRTPEPAKTPSNGSPEYVSGVSRSHLAFSPDGKNVLYLQEEHVEEPAVHGRIWSRTVSLHWCRASDPATISSTAIETLGPEFKGDVEVPNLQVKWSRSGLRIGVLTPDKLVLVDVSSGEKTEVRDGQVMGFGWLSDRELAYCSRRTRGAMQEHVVCRQDFTGERKTEIVAFPEYPGTNLELDFSWRTHWSPSGEYVIFLEPSHRGQFYCVNLFDGTKRAFGQMDVSDEGVAWAPDSKHAFCVSYNAKPENAYEALLLEAATGRLSDCAMGFERAFGKASPTLQPVWTPDGKYVLANHVYTCGFLLRPDPWEVTPIGRIVATKLPNATTPWLFSLPVPGWVGVLPTGNIGDSPIKYAVDYSGERVCALGELGDDWSVSPDGTSIAVFVNEAVTVRTLGKWWLPRATTTVNLR